MQKTTYYCDRCGAELKTPPEPIILKDWTRRYNKYYEGDVKVYDLCRECREEFERFVKDGKRS